MQYEYKIAKITYMTLEGQEAVRDGRLIEVGEFVFFSNMEGKLYLIPARRIKEIEIDEALQDDKGNWLG